MANDDVKLSLSLDEKELLKQLDDLKKRSEKALEFKVDNKELRKNQRDLTRTLEDTNKLRKSMLELRDTRVKTDAWTKLNNEVEEYNKKIEGTQERIKNLFEKGYTPDSGWVKNAQLALEKQMAARGPLLGQLRSLESRGVDTKLYSETEEYKKQLALLNEKQKLIRGNLIPIEHADAIQKGITEQEQVQSGATSQETAALKALEDELARVEEKWRNVHAQQEKIRNTKFGAVADESIPRGQDLEYDKLRDKALELSTVMGDLQYKIWHFNDAVENMASSTNKAQDSIQSTASAYEVFMSVALDSNRIQQIAKYREILDGISTAAKQAFEQKQAGKNLNVPNLVTLAKNFGNLQANLQGAQHYFEQFGITLEKANQTGLLANNVYTNLSRIQKMLTHEYNQAADSANYLAEIIQKENMSVKEQKGVVKLLSSEIADYINQLNALKLQRPHMPQEEWQRQCAEIENNIRALTDLRNKYKDVKHTAEEPVNIDVPTGPKVEETLLGMLAKLRELKQEKKELEKISSPSLEEAQRYEEVLAEIEHLNVAIAQYKKGMQESASADDTSANAKDKNAKSANKLDTILKKLHISSLGIKEVMKGYSKHMKSAESAHNKFMRSIKHGMSNLTKYVFGFRSLFFLIRKLRSGIKEGIKNLVQYDSANNETNKAMTELMTSLLFVKNAWGAAFAPILNVVLPALSALLDMIAAVGNALAMFFGRLTGATSVIQAVRVQTQDYADSLRNVGGGASGASKAADKLHDRLAAFDDLNVLGKDDQNDPSKSGGGGGAGNLDVPAIEDMFTRELAQSSLADMIREAWFSDGDMAEVGALFADFIEGSLERIPWQEIQDTAGRLGFSAGTFLTGLFGDEGMWQSIGSTFAQGLNTASEAIHGFFEGYDGGLGSGAITAINEFLVETDWHLIGENVGDALTTVANDLADFLDGVDVELLADSWEEFADGVKDPELLAAVNALNAAFGGLVYRLGTGGLGEWLWRNQTFVLIFIPALMALAQAISFVNAHIDEWKANLRSNRQALKDNEDKINDIKRTIKDFVDNAIAGISELNEFVRGIYVAIVLGIFTPLIAWIELIKLNVELFKNKIRDEVEEIKRINREALDNIKSKFTDVKTAIVDDVKYIKNQIAFYFDLAADAIEAFFGVFSGWGTVRDGFISGANGILSLLETFVNRFISGVNNIISVMTALSGAGEMLEAVSGGNISINWSIAPLSPISLPRLAQGAVIPANHEFAAILGDQRHGTNIEAPLDTIKQAVAEVIANNNNDEVIRLLQQLIGVVESKNLSIGDRQIGEANARYQNRQNVIRGVRGVV